MIDARLLIRRGDLDRAEGLLLAASPHEVSPQADRLLFLAWIKAAHRQFDAAAALLQQVEELGFYSSRLLSRWRNLIPPSPETALPPDEIPLIPWLLHRAAMALEHDDPAQALAWVERALRESRSRTEVTNQAAHARAALPALNRLARAQALAHLARIDPEQCLPPSGLYRGAIEAFDADPQGRQALDAAQRGDIAQARQALDTLADCPDLPATLAHHLALIYFRAAWHFEEHKPHYADPYWGRSWRCWLRWAASATADDRALVFDWLLAIHRHRIQELLGRDAVDRARQHWNCIMELPQLAAGNEELTEALAAMLTRFRDQLATESRVQTQEALCFGAVADYESALHGLTRLLSLDRENLSLLTCLTETCVAWFFDCYHNDDAASLLRTVERFTPFALQLARLLEQTEKPELNARAALAEFFKFRGLAAHDPARKAALYREALRFHPGNANVRELLSEVENDA